MINVRSSVFETNSSSTHSITLNFNDSVDLTDTIYVNSDGKIVLSGGDFSYTEIYIDKAISKANFIAVYMCVYGDEQLKLRLEKVLKEQTGASEIVYDIRMIYFDGKPANSFFSTEYNNPYDYDNSDSFQDIIKDEDKLRKFIFNSSSRIYAEIGYDG